MNLLEGQIHLYRPPLPPRPIPPLPAGYIMRTFKEGEESEIARLMVESGFKGWTAETVRQKALCGKLGAKGVLVIEYEGRLVMTVTVLLEPSTKDGSLVYTPAWLASEKAHRGKALGRIIGLEAWRVAYEAGCPSCEVRTDDWRLPAVRQYLKHGFEPIEKTALDRARWRLIRRLLSHPTLTVRTAQFKGRKKLWNRALFWERYFPWKLFEGRRQKLAAEILSRAAESAETEREES